MDSTILTAAAGVLGALVGAGATIATAWVSQKMLSKREMIRMEIDKDELLYGEFISQCSKLIIDAYGHTLERPETVLPAYALLNRIRLSASDAVLREAEHIMTRITEQYFSANLSPEEMRMLVRSPATDPLKAFGEACRAELKSLRANV